MSKLLDPIAQLTQPREDDHPYHSISLMGISHSFLFFLDLGQYRIKSHCHTDPNYVNTHDYLIFQIEILDPELQRYYQGSFILEVQTRLGDRLFQRVLKEEVKHWKLCNNVFTFKTSKQSPLIHVVWLHERKIASIKHPFEDFNEVDFIYFEGYLIVANRNNVRFIQVAPSESTTQLTQFSNTEENLAQLLQKESVGVLSQKEIFKIIQIPFKNELLFLAVNDKQQVVKLKYKINNDNSQKFTLEEVYEASIKKVKLDKRAKKLQASLAPIIQSHVIVKDQLPYLILLRKEEVLEVLENFTQTIYIEQIPKISSLLPAFGEQVAIQYQDQSISLSQEIDKINERVRINTNEYYKMMHIPPKSSQLNEMMLEVHFYQDLTVVNQTMFILRDNAIFIIDIPTQKVIKKVLSKPRIVGLYKLKQTRDDENGYKMVSYKVIAVSKLGSIIALVSEQENDQLQETWQKQEINMNKIIENKELVKVVFSNQYSQNYVYICTINPKNEQKIYAIPIDHTKLIELNGKFNKDDKIMNLYATSRSREFLCLIDNKAFTIYRHEQQGSLIKYFSMSIVNSDLRELAEPGTITYLFRDVVIAFAKKKIYKIYLKTNYYECIRLHDPIQKGGNIFLDGFAFYFLVKPEDKAHSKLAILTVDMINNAFTEGQRQFEQKDEDRDTRILINKLYYPTWKFDNQNIKALDFDEFNNVVNLLLSNQQVVQAPLYHRNTMHFMGMGERTFYIAYKQIDDKFYALDKQNFINCWNINTGVLLSRDKLVERNYMGYELQRKVYDKNWFPYFLISKQEPVINQLSNNFLYDFIIIEFDQNGRIQEKLNFKANVLKDMEVNLYFSSDFTQMIELVINNNDKNHKASYNLYQWSSSDVGMWSFIQTLNTPERNFTEWHKKTLYPYNMNMNKFVELDKEKFSSYDLYKWMWGGKIKVLTHENIEMILDGETGKIESFVNQQYQFQNARESFYDNRSGQLFLNEVTVRLQNYYEGIRKQMFLANKLQNNVRNVDLSTKKFLYKYLIEESFTQFDWRFYSQFIFNNDKTAPAIIKSLSIEHLKRFIHNVFQDKGNTLLHYLAYSSKAFEVIDYLNKQQKAKNFIVPFTVNQDELTPMDILIRKKQYDQKQTNSLVNLLSNSPLDHHSRLIAHLIPDLVQLGVPALEKYFDRRQFKVGICHNIDLGKLKIRNGYEFTASPVTMVQETEESITKSLMHAQAKEQSIKLEILDLPLASQKIEDLSILTENKLAINQQSLNSYEIQMIKGLANTQNQDIFQQKSIRAFIDFLWPQSRTKIVQNIFLPYLAFVVYYMIYCMVLKRLNYTQQKDPYYFKFTSDMFNVYNMMFRLILFLGCFYFFYQDFLQIKSFSNNKIVLWSYANIFPLIIMIFIICYDTFIDNSNPSLERAFYSATAFFVWIRVVHLMKCFTQTAYILRMGTQILFRMRYLICFILISLIAFGFTFFFLSPDIALTPYDGIQYIALLQLGQYNTDDFAGIYLYILFVLLMLFNVFFVFTMLVGLAVQAFSYEGSDAWSNEAYKDKASLIALYSYLLQETPCRDNAKKYLMVATVTEAKSQVKLSQAQSQQLEQRKQQLKLLKAFDSRISALTSNVNKSLREIKDKVEALESQQPRAGGRN